MRKTAFTTILNAPTSNEAESAIARLKSAGFHPAELALTTTVPFSKNSKRKFPVEVPANEVTGAKRTIENGKRAVRRKP